MRRDSAFAPLAAVLFCCAAFIALGLLFAPLAGIQNDEAIFAAPLYNPPSDERSITVFGRKYEAMLLNYLGTLKAVPYWPLFKRWKPSVYSVRLPVILAGAGAIWLLWLLLRRTAGERAAVIACLLLATDASFLLTTVFDWGPVALQHLLMLGGMLLVVRYRESQSLVRLGAGFLCFGLAMWDKALFVWMLSGLTVATVIVFPREVFQSLRPRPILIAAAGFLLGASPFIIFNLQHPRDNVSSNVVINASELPVKWSALRGTMDGSTLFGYITGEDHAGSPRQPGTFIERASQRLSEAAGNPRHSLMLEAYALALFLAPLVWKTRHRRFYLFCLLSFTVAWVQMALTNRAGGAVHHTILLWPIPTMFAALAYTAASEFLSRRGGAAVLAALTGVLFIANLTVVNQHHAQLVRNGAAGVWTDAILKLPAVLKPLKAERICAADWGVIDNLYLLSRGTLPLCVAGDTLKDNPTPDDRKALQSMLAAPNLVFLTWAEGRDVVPGTNERFRKMSAEAGYRLEVIETVLDRNGRPQFLILRPRPAESQPAKQA